MTSAPLGDAEEQFRLLVENVRDYALFFTDPERRVVTWNAGAERIMGWSEAEMIGRSADIIFTPEDRAKGDPDNEAGRAALDGRAENERWHLRKDGSRFWGSGIMTALKDEDGTLRGFCKLFRDLTECREWEERLRRQADLVELAYDAIIVTDPDDDVVLWNRAAEELYGWPRAEALGKAARELLATRFSTSYAEARATLEATGRWEGELTQTCRHGNKIVVASRWSLQRDGWNRPAAVLEVNRDITERHRPRPS
jgi:two-component system CheB/CheR fusion protein